MVLDVEICQELTFSCESGVRPEATAEPRLSPPSFAQRVKLLRLIANACMSSSESTGGSSDYSRCLP